jgi:hypothetical protein
MARFFQPKLNFSLYYQNLIGKRFSKNSKRNWFRKVEIIIKWGLIFDHLLAVNTCGLQAKKKDFQRLTVKSRSNQIWISLFEASILASILAEIKSTYEVFGTCYLAARIIPKSDFPEL